MLGDPQTWRTWSECGRLEQGDHGLRQMPPTKRDSSAAGAAWSLCSVQVGPGSRLRSRAVVRYEDDLVGFMSMETSLPGCSSRCQCRGTAPMMPALRRGRAIRSGPQRVADGGHWRSWREEKGPLTSGLKISAGPERSSSQIPSQAVQCAHERLHRLRHARVIHLNAHGTGSLLCAHRFGG